MNYAAISNDIELAIERKGIALGIDWTNETQVRALAKEALEHMKEDVKLAELHPNDHQLMAKIDLFGLAGSMLRTMEQSANHGIESHGGTAWKAFAKAIWAEMALRDASE